LYTEKGTGNERNYFAKTAQTRNVEEALDALFRGELQGAIVDSPSLALYKELQPGRFDRLKTVAESDPFPPAVIVYHDRTLSNNLLKLLKQRMLKVKDSDKGKEALAAFRISGFESVPADYQKTLTSILQAYPAKEGD
jgi:ABC-type phosphate/phosphonate transport system substrate-binding protein